MTAPRDHLDPLALRQGASVALMFALPFGIAAAVVRDERHGLAVVLSVIALAGLFLGGAVAGWKQQRQAPLTNGIVTALGVFVVIQVAGVVRRLVAGDPLHLGRIASGVVLSAVAGALGGVVGSWVIRPPQESSGGGRP